jgi:hypothetical protein
VVPLPAWSLPAVGSLVLVSIIILALGFCGSDSLTGSAPAVKPEQVIGNAVFTTLPSKLSVILESPVLSSTVVDDTPRTI